MSCPRVFCICLKTHLFNLLCSRLFLRYEWSYHGMRHYRTLQPLFCYIEWLKCNRAQLGNAVLPPAENGSRRSPTSNFLWTQGNVRRNTIETEYSVCADCMQLQCQVITSCFAFQMKVTVIETNPNWSILRGYVATKTIVHGGPWLQQRRPQPQTGA